jgi:hypothetical protein
MPVMTGRFQRHSGSCRWRLAGGGKTWGRPSRTNSQKRQKEIVSKQLIRCADPADLENELGGIDALLADWLADTLLKGIDLGALNWAV